MKTFFQFILIGFLITLGSVFFYGGDSGDSRMLALGLALGGQAGATVALFVLPSLIARNKKHEHRKWIYLINFILGATGLGWIISLLWALEIIRLPKKTEITGTIREGVGTDDVIKTIDKKGDQIANAIEKSNSYSNQETGAQSSDVNLDRLKKLHDLHKLGAITESEYRSQKSKLLS